MPRSLDALLAIGLLAVLCIAVGAGEGDLPYRVVDTGQSACYDTTREIQPPSEGKPFYGQDAQYQGPSPAYKDSGDGTVTDLNTGLIWQQDPGEKVTWDVAMSGAASLRLAGRDDWRVPTIKELCSLMDFRGAMAPGTGGTRPFIDTKLFVCRYGDPARGERPIDAQFCSSTQYVSTTMNGNPTVFGVNFVDGRIKGYPRSMMAGGRRMMFFCRYVCGNPRYGVNDFLDNGDGTATDKATGLTWMQKDSGAFEVGGRSDGRLNWQQALDWAESLTFAGDSDWRLPNAKELQSIVDYARSPATTGSAAMSSVFQCTPITGEAGTLDYAFYWTSTTHLDGPVPAMRACYVSFGRAYGCMGGWWLDVHGAGAQRSDPKTGDPSAYPYGFGPQGDAIRIFNLARCVRGGAGTTPFDRDSPPAGSGATDGETR